MNETFFVYELEETSYHKLDDYVGEIPPMLNLFGYQLAIKLLVAATRVQINQKA